MSKCQTIKGQCPSCFKEQEVTLWDSVNITLNPDLKPKVLSQDILRLRCSACHGILMLGYPLLYHDMNQQFMVSFEPQVGIVSGRPGPADYRLRVVHSPNHLIEKIVVFDAGLDDRAVEALKYSICHDLIASFGDALLKLEALPINTADLLCIGTSEAGGDRQMNFMIPLLGQVPGSLLRVTIQVYHQARQMAEEVPDAASNGKWHTIDHRWAERIFGERRVVSGVQLMFSPEFILHHPIAKSILERHFELVA